PPAHVAQPPSAVIGEARWGLGALEISMLGEHQVENAALAVAAVQHLPFLVPDDAIRAGLKAAFIPGRLEVVQQHPLVILDGAHNPPKGAALRAALASLFPSEAPPGGGQAPAVYGAAGRRRVLLLALGSIKDADA